MARHSQKINIVCINCKRGSCDLCIDTLRKCYAEDPICMCLKKDHDTRVAWNEVTIYPVEPLPF